jgi:hypothetical protein
LSGLYPNIFSKSWSRIFWRREEGDYGACHTSHITRHTSHVTRHTRPRSELNLAYQLKSFRGKSVFDLVFVEIIQQLSAESMGDFLNSKNFKKFRENQEGLTPEPPVDAPDAPIDKLLLLDCFDPGLAYSEMPQPLSDLPAFVQQEEHVPIPTLTCHTSHVTRHTSHVTRHTSHVTRHTSYVTRHTSHVTFCSGSGSGVFTHLGEWRFLIVKQQQQQQQHPHQH